MTTDETRRKLLQELGAVFSGIEEVQIVRFVQELREAPRVFVLGLGRVLLMLKAFAMRLVHLGMEAHVLGDATTPGAKAGDLLVIGSASGETSTTVLIAEKARTLGMRTILVTASTISQLGKLSDLTVYIDAPTKTGGAGSIQPMATLFEQTMLLFLDLVILGLMADAKVDPERMTSTHANLE